MLSLQLEQARNEMEEGWFQIKVLEISAEQAHENLKITSDNYDAGTIGISDLLEAQAIYQEALDKSDRCLMLLSDKICQIPAGNRYVFEINFKRIFV